VRVIIFREASFTVVAPGSQVDAENYTAIFSNTYYYYHFYTAGSKDPRG